MAGERPDAERKAELTRLMQAYERDILNLCCIYLRDISLAQDAVQETFFKAYKALAAFRGDCNEKTWLTRIAINTCKDMRRAAWYRFVDRRVTLERLPPPAVPAKAESVLMTLEVMRLPARYRDAVLLRYYQGMSVGETARALGVSTTAVSKRLKHACEKLRLTVEGGTDDA